MIQFRSILIFEVLNLFIKLIILHLYINKNIMNKIIFTVASFLLLCGIKGYTQSCIGNLLPNGSLENGTFSSFTTADPQITGTLTIFC